MSVTIDMTVIVADVEVTDDYQVELRTPIARKRRTILDLAAAERLGLDLLAAAEDARRMLAEDRAAADADQAVHGFDVDPVICRDCREGKHGACIGSAHVERGDEIDEVACQCPADGHRGRS
ncbi:hypothetical protein [Microbacterium sp. NPDC080220]|uniref:hypothetical protein n=1 Tax=Microbacterium sp. NPDC080220 TaxID=3161017 RepID=UPI00341C61C9